VSNPATSAPPGLIRRILIGRNPKVTLIRIVIWVAALFLISKFVLLPIRVQGISMLPTYRENRFNLVNRLAYLFHEPRRGDVVAIRLAGEHIMYMKRIVGLPGESVGFHDGYVTINGQPLEEPYLKLSSSWNRPPVQLGATEYFFVGDNRSMSQLEHEFGRAPRERIAGRLVL
jgi:signal peptidase I